MAPWSVREREEALRLLQTGMEQLGCTAFAGRAPLLVELAVQVLEKNSQVNLTAMTGVRDVVAKHLLDSLTPFLVVDPAAGTSVVDIGSGGGFPGLPLALCRPDLRFTLVDANGKKARALEDLRRRLAVEGTVVVQGRAEDLGRRPEYRESFDLAVARAVAPLPVLAEFCLPLVRPGGSFLAMKGPGLEQELAAASRALELLGGRPAGTRRLELPFNGGERALQLIRKHKTTPPSYPRRPGKPAQHPL